MSEDRSQDAATDRVTVQEAARRLGVKEDTIRKRIQRGSIRHQKGTDGRMWVWTVAAPERSQDEGEASQDEYQDTYRDTSQDARVETDLREQVAYLRRLLEEEREARRRADVILGQLSQANAEQARTIRALEAPEETPREEAPEDAEEVEETPEPPRSRPTTPPRGPEGLRSFLRRRIFGG